MVCTLGNTLHFDYNDHRLVPNLLPEDDKHCPFQYLLIFLQEPANYRIPVSQWHFLVAS